MYGYDKATFDDRVKFAEENIESIFETADRPFGFDDETNAKMWWRQSENPWQTLAAAVELAAALRFYPFFFLGF